MKSLNLITTYEGYEALLDLKLEPDGPLKIHEIRNLHSLCTIMTQENCTIGDLSGFFIGYSIKQIGKEFDLLKFTKDGILNIELKTELLMEGKEEKILKQMRTNHYYLNAITQNITIITYVENDGFYLYDPATSTLSKTEPAKAAEVLKQTKEDHDFDPDQRFIPSAYLISPFKDTEKFMQDQYFLTTAQNAIKKEILEDYHTGQYMLYTIAAGSGTGKTLLLYDIAKELFHTNEHICILHQQPLNEGQQNLISQYHWRIYASDSCDFNELFQDTQLLLIDEAQLMNEEQIHSILTEANEKQISVLFSYDQKQVEYSENAFDITKYIQENYPSVKLSQNKLTNKIRTNYEMADFLENLMKPGLNNNHHPYSNITLEYIKDPSSLSDYCSALQQEEFQIIAINDLDIKQLNQLNYKKIVLILDQNYYYAAGELHTKNHKEEILYEVIGRVIEEMKIIVLDNPELYHTILETLKH